MERNADLIGPRQLASVIVFGLVLGVATFLVLLNTLFASSGPSNLDEVLERYSPRESASLGLAVGGAGFAPRMTEATLAVTGTATVTVPLSAEITLGVSGASVTIPVDVLDMPAGDLGAYQFNIAFDDSVLEMSTVLGGDSPFDGVTAFSVAGGATGSSVVAWNSFQGGSVSVPAEITVANVVFIGIGAVGECSTIDLTVEELVDNSAVATDNTHQDGEICLAAADADAETDLVAVQDTDDVALPTGVKSTIDLVKDGITGDPLPSRKVASYEANITFPASLAVATECRLKAPFDIGVTDCAISSGLVHQQASSTTTGAAVAAPIDPLAFVALRLIGSNDSITGLTTVDLNFVEIIDEFGDTVAQDTPPDTRTFLRGDALANGNISISDALFIAQHLVAPVFRPVGEGGGEVNPVNAGSVNHDSPNDVISLADAVLIAQFLVGNVDEFYDPIP